MGIAYLRTSRLRSTELPRALPEIAVLALTGQDEPDFGRALKQLGARGYLRKTLSGQELALAVRAVAAGQTLAWGGAAVATPAWTEALSECELEVLRLMAAGQRNAEIASALDIWLKTVEFHVGHLLDKLGARSPTEAVARAREHGRLL